MVPIPKANQVRWTLIAILSTASTICSQPTNADPPADAVLIDGLSALAGGSTANESDANPILLSDVELDASLHLVLKLGPQGLNQPIDEPARRAARNRAVLVQILAERAKRLGDALRADQLNQFVAHLTARAGGKTALASLLKRYGADQSYLNRFAESNLLAAGQIRTATEQSDNDMTTLLGWLKDVLTAEQLRIIR